jgi:hypothetical protein
MLSTEEQNILKDSLEEISLVKKSITSLTNILIHLENQLRTVDNVEKKEALFSHIQENQLNYVHISSLLNSIEASNSNFGGFLVNHSLHNEDELIKQEKYLQELLGLNHYNLLYNIVKNQSIFNHEMEIFQQHFNATLIDCPHEIKKQMLVDFKLLLGDNNHKCFNLSETQSLEKEGILSKKKTSKKEYFTTQITQIKQVVSKTILKGTIMSDSLNKKIKEGVDASKEVVKSYAPKVKDELVKTLEPTIQKTAKGAKDFLNNTVDKIVDDLLSKPAEEASSLDEKYKTYSDFCLKNKQTPVARDKFEELFKAEKSKVETPKFDIGSIKDELKNISAEQVVKQIVKNVFLAKKGPWGIAISVAFDAIVEAQKENRKKKEAQEIAKKVEEATQNETVVAVKTETVETVKVNQEAAISATEVKASEAILEKAVAQEIKETKKEKDLTLKTKQDLFECWISFISLVKTTSKKDRVSSRGLYENYVEFCQAQELENLMYNQAAFTRQFKQKMNVKNEEVSVVDGKETRVFNFKMKK